MSEPAYLGLFLLNPAFLFFVRKQTLSRGRSLHNYDQLVFQVIEIQKSHSSCGSHMSISSISHFKHDGYFSWELLSIIGLKNASKLLDE